MDAILSTLGNLLNYVKNLTLPGLVAALGFVLILWPPHVIDVVSDVQVAEKYQGPKWPPSAKGLNKEQMQKQMQDLAGSMEAVCETFGTLRALPSPSRVGEVKGFAVANQFNLERIARNLNECTEKEKALAGAEDNELADIKSQIDVLQKQRDGLEDTYIAYEKAANPLSGRFKAQVDQKEKDISDKQEKIRGLDQANRERQRRLTELDRLSKDVTALLGEPGRLRPKAKFDDFLSSLGGHVIAFLTLAIVWSLLFEPINRALFGLVYDNAFRDRLDVLYYFGRNPPLPRARVIPIRVWLAVSAAFLVVVFLAVATPAAMPRESVAASPCGLDPVRCEPGHQLALGQLMLKCFLWTLVGALASVLFSWLVVTFLYARKEQEAHSNKNQASIALVREFRKNDGDQKPPDEKKKEDEPKETKCEKNLRELWPKISQPPYAIGQGLLSRDDYSAIQEQYYGQSQISVGLILPTLFLLFSILATPQLGVSANLSVWTALAMVQATLLYVGVDRRHKFETEVESLIASQFLKTCEAKQEAAQEQAAAGTTEADAVRQQLQSLLEGATIGDKNLTVVLAPETAPSKPPKTSAHAAMKQAVAEAESKAVAELAKKAGEEAVKSLMTDARQKEMNEAVQNAVKKALDDIIKKTGGGQEGSA